jgi:hypothetical protein
MKDNEYLPPELTENVLTAIGEIESGVAVGRPIEDIIAEREKDPNRKIALDAARARLRTRKEAGLLTFAVRPIVLTERGLMIVPDDGDDPSGSPSP